MRLPPLIRTILWLALVALAYAFGRWHHHAGAAAAAPLAPKPTAAVTTAVGMPAKPAAPVLTRAEQVVADARDLAETARKMANPDSRTYAFFENLKPEDLAPVMAFVHDMPAGNEQDLFAVMLIRRWADYDARAALAQTATIGALSVRIAAQLAAWESWGTHDPAAAMLEATKLSEITERDRVCNAILGAAATTNFPSAVDLWRVSPVAFQQSPAGRASIAQMVMAAYGTGQLQNIQTLIAATPENPVRDVMISELARQWGPHAPDEFMKWLATTMPAGESRENTINDMFTAFARKDPPQAAAWGAGYPDEHRRAGYIAAAIAEWVSLDAAAAETWINEQASDKSLDGASYAMAAHFLNDREMTRSFGWIRRIVQQEPRSDMLANLGRIWSQERPDEFRKFLDKTSLNRAEVEMLLSKITPAT